MNCPNCGAENRENTSFCSKCGTPLTEEAADILYQAEHPTDARAAALIKSLCKRLRVSAILLLITGILMLIGSVASAVVGLICIFQQRISYFDITTILSQFGVKMNDVPFLSDMDPSTLQFTSLAIVITFFVCCAVVIAMGIVNVVYACKTFGSIRGIKRDTIYITDRFGTTGKGVALLVLNILFGGGILGFIGSIFAIVARSYVKSHYPEFNAIDNDTVVEETEEPAFRH